MRYKYFFFEKHRPELVDWLNENGISFKLDGGGCVPVFVNFTLWSNTTNIQNHLAQLESIHVKKPVITAEYTAAELSKAKLLRLCSRKQCIEITNSSDAYQYSCTWVNPHGIKKVRHSTQKALFEIAREPSCKTTTAFWHEETGFAELFTDRRVLELAERNNLVGIDFNPVTLKNGKTSQNIFQITSSHKLTKDCLGFGYGEIRSQCPICGKEQFFINAAYQLHLDLNRIGEQSDLYVTERIFGEGRPYPVYLVTQRFYRIIKASKLAGNLIFSPVFDITL